VRRFIIFGPTRSHRNRSTGSFASSTHLACQKKPVAAIRPVHVSCTDTARERPNRGDPARLFCPTRGVIGVSCNLMINRFWLICSAPGITAWGPSTGLLSEFFKASSVTKIVFHCRVPQFSWLLISRIADPHSVCSAP
jgi:hypothetical protein